MAGLSEAFTYVPKPAAAPAANIRVSVPPHNKDMFTQGNEPMMFNIPAGKRGQYLNTRMSYLQFDLEVGLKDIGTAAAKVPVLALDGGAHAFIDALEVYHGSNLLEQIRDYNALHQTLMDLGEDKVAINGPRMVAEGMQGFVLDNAPSSRNADLWRTGKVVSPVSLPPRFRNVKQSSTNPSTSTSYAALEYPVEPAESKAQFETFAAKSGELDLGATASYSGLSGATATAATNSVTDINTALSSLVTSLSSQAGGAVTQNIGDYCIALAVLGETIRYTFAIPLVSGIVGVQQGKYLPVGALAADLKLELHLGPWEEALKTVGILDGGFSGGKATNGTKFKADPASIQAIAGQRVTDTHTIKIDRVELQLEYVEVAADVQMAIEAASGGQYVMSYDSFSNFQNTIAGNQGSISQLIGARFSSIKTALTLFRDQFKIRRLEHSGVCSRVNPFSSKLNRPEFASDTLPILDNRYEPGTGWWYSIGSTYYPPKMVETHPEAYMELIKSQHSVAGQHMPGLITPINWTTSARRDALSTSNVEAPDEWWQFTSPGGTFIMAQNFESQSHKSHLTESGVNTLAQNMYVNARFPQGGTVTGVRVSTDGYLLKTGGSALIQAQAAMQMDTFIHYDGILIISNGICSTRF